MDFKNILNKSKEIFLGIIYSIRDFAIRIYKFLSKWIGLALEKLPIPSKYRRLLTMVSLSVILVAVVIVSVPVVRTVTSAVGIIADHITGNQGPSQNISEVSSGFDPNYLAPELEDVLPEQLEVPNNDILEIPTGSSVWRFSEQELLRLQGLLIYTEKCNSFSYNDSDKDKNMALTAYRLLVETNNQNLTINESPYYYTVRDMHLQKYINGIFGRNLSSTENLGDILYDNRNYLYFYNGNEPTSVSAYITNGYSLGDNFYKISGIVTRGFAGDEGRYSRRISIILLKNSAAEYGYYVVSVVNEPMTYTYLDSLLNTLPPDENALLHVGRVPGSSANTSSVASSVVSGNTASESTGTASESPDNTSSIEDTSSATPVESVTQPETDGYKKVSFNKAEKQSLVELFSSIPVSLTDFDSDKESSEGLRILAAHLALCKDSNTDYSSSVTSNAYSDISSMSEKLFGKGITSLLPEQLAENYTLDPFIATSKTDFSVSEVYDLGNNRYMAVCDAEYYSNPLLEKPDSKYVYTAVIERSESAKYGFLLKSQTYVLK